MKDKQQTEMSLGVKFVPPKLVEVIDWGYLYSLPIHECEKFHAYYSSNGWKVGRNPMKSWRDALTHWKLVWLEKDGHHLNRTTKIEGKTRTVYELTKIIEAKQKIADELKRKYSSEVAGGRQWSDFDRQAEFRKICKEIKDLTAQLAAM